MNNWIIKRLLKSAVTIWAVITFSFALVHLLPGGPMQYIRGQLIQRYGASSISQEKMQKLIEIYTGVQPDAPLWKQYLDYLASVLQGDFGYSIAFNRPVIDIIAQALPWTVFIMTISLVMTFVLGISLGAIMAYYEGTRFDFFASSGSTILNSTPYYLAALILLFVLGYQMSLFPLGGRMAAGTTPGLNLPFLLGVLHHAALPILSLVITETGGWALSMRGNSISVLGEEYLRVARIRGLSDRHIIGHYVTRNAILPLYTGFVIAIGFVFGGSVILERIFTYPGIGYYMVSGVEARDYPLIMGSFLILTIAVVIGLLLADLTYSKLDPRIEPGGESNESY